MFIPLLLIATTAFARNNYTICGEADERRLSNEREIGRVIKPDAQVGCTITLVGRACAISAGHCLMDLQIAQFNTFLNYYGHLSAKPEDTYEIDQSSIQSQNAGHGKDWSVFRLKPNAVTKRLAGDVQGYLGISWLRVLPIGSSVTITGYGWKNQRDTKNGPQQTHTASLMGLQGTSFYYDVDTMGGNSGSSVVNAANEIIGVHTHGYCSEDGGANQGTMLSRHEQFKAALKECLRVEKTFR